MGSSTVVIDPRFCFPGEIHLTIVKKIMPISAGNFRVTNDKGDIMFNVKERLLSFHSRHVLLDAAGNTIAALKKKIFGEDQRWQVYKRDSSDPDDVVSSATQFRTGELNVVLGHKKEKNAWDFKVVGRWLERCRRSIGLDA
ncbi:protein LURP-one-related 15-like [Primulina huaijiensis]|uniref:protein LURP-one-related 15-like n=1 Tax=Primulina huaijiensis TaxID=1492673 RepID=UPI003CC76231